MNNDIQQLCDALETLATATKNAWGNDSLLVEAIGWNAPPLTRHDLASLPSILARDIRAADPETIDEETLTFIRDCPRRLQLLQAHTLPQMFSGNSPQAVPAFIGTIAFIRQLLAPMLDWQVINDPKAMPAALARRVRSFHAEMEQLAPKKEELEGRISDISRAHAAAESLPVDLQALTEARKTLAESIAEAKRTLAESVARAGEGLTSIKNNSQESYAEVEYMKHLKEGAEKTLALCEEAYRASTTRGLASAFDQRAKRHGHSMLGWIAGLVLALFAGAYAGQERVQMLSTAVSVPDPKWSAIAMQALLSIASIAAPIWFAWIATKQIGQRFRLAEDYSFKASVAKAYEGYRKEAARIDPSFESRLFDSALTRLEEAPLRLVESETHGSPWHELIESEAFLKAMDMVPELAEKCAKMSQSGAKTVKSALSKLSKPSSTTKTKPEKEVSPAS